MPPFARLFLLAILLVALPAASELAPIQLDGYFDDWTSLAAKYDDSNDVAGTVDFGQIWVANDQDFWYLRFETEGEVQPDEQQNMMLYLDTDMNATTGQSYRGIGAELVWEFGLRQGTFIKSGTFNVEHADVGIQIGPTVSSTQFEVALPRDSEPASGRTLFSGSNVRFILRDLDSGDIAPGTGSIEYTFAVGSDVAPTISLDRADPGHIRIATWNIQSDGLFDGGTTEAAHNRMLDAMDPDVLIVNEVWNHNATEVKNKIEQHLPSGPGQAWYAVMRDNGNVIVSRFPIQQSWEINPGYRLTGALLDLGAASDKDLLVIAGHLRCCTADYDRQQEVDSVIEFLRDAKTPGGVITLDEGTPFVLAGDLNLVGWRQQLETLITGDIQNEGTYGPDDAPDWDGANFAFANSRHPDGRSCYTWRNDFSSFLPGVLDYVFYSDSVLDLQNHFVLETRTMKSTTLSANGLLAYDTSYASDHAPHVADFTIYDPASPVPSFETGARLLPNVPNPFNPSTVLRFELHQPGEVELRIFDARGHAVRTFTAQPYSAGVHGVTWDGTDRAGRKAASGVYMVQMTSRQAGRTLRENQSIVLVE